jgi:hypothetical protein
VEVSGGWWRLVECQWSVGGELVEVGGVLVELSGASGSQC